jgi:hypothetical protein
VPECSKIDQMALKYTNIFHRNTLQNLPKSVFLVWRRTIWQPRSECICCRCNTIIGISLVGISTTTTSSNWLEIYDDLLSAYTKMHPCRFCGQCYDWLFLPIFGEKLAVLSTNQCYFDIFFIISCILSQKRKYFRQFLGIDSWNDV